MEFNYETEIRMKAREIKKIIVEYLKAEYSDEKLKALFLHTRDGKLSYMSCCCFAGIPSASHELNSEGFQDIQAHNNAFSMIELNQKLWTANDAFDQLADNDDERRAKLLPLIEAEVKRRNLK